MQTVTHLTTMSHAVEVDGDGYRIYSDDELEAYVHEWTEFVNGEEFREALWDLKAVVEQDDVGKLLIDQREMTVIDEDDMGWVAETFGTELEDAGIEYNVIVLAESSLAEMNFERFTDEIDIDPAEDNHDVTTDIEEARELIRTH